MATTDERRVNKLIDRAARGLARALRSFFKDELAIVIDAMRSRTVTQAVEVTHEQRVALLYDVMHRYLEYAHRKGYEMVMNEEKPGNFMKRIETIVLNTNRALRGLSSKDDVNTFYEKYSAMRSKSLAITEINSAFNTGINKAANDLQNMIDKKEQERFALNESPLQTLIRLAGPVKPKGKRYVYREWRAQADSRVRDAHADAHGQEKILGKPFVVDGEELMYPGDPSGSPENIINCRCYERIRVRVQ